MSQRQQLERIFEIDHRIRAGLYPNARQLAQSLEVTSRVIYKDREFMLDRLGAPIVFDRDRGGWAYSDRTWLLPTSIVTEGELLAFFLSIELAQRYLGTAFGEALASAISKVARSLKGPVVVDLDALQAHYTFFASGRSGSEGRNPDGSASGYCRPTIGEDGLLHRQPPEAHREDCRSLPPVQCER